MNGKHATNEQADKAGLEQTARVSSQGLLRKAHMATAHSQALAPDFIWVQWLQTGGSHTYLLSHLSPEQNIYQNYTFLASEGCFLSPINWNIVKQTNKQVNKISIQQQQ